MSCSNKLNLLINTTSMLCMNILIIFSHFIILISGATEFFINTNKLTTYKHKRACPRGYELATLNTEELWKEAVAYSAQVMGFDKRVWVKQALNWNGSGKEQWLIATPTNPLTCKFPPENLDQFCVPNEQGKLVVNHLPRRKVPSLCMKKQNV
jgi:hypothetical protein